MADEKRERKTMVYCKNTLGLEGANGGCIKVKKGFKVLMSDDEYKHFKGVATKDVPDDAPEFKRV